MTDDRVETALRRLLDEARAEVQRLHFDCRVYAEKLEAAEAALVSRILSGKRWRGPAHV